MTPGEKTLKEYESEVREFVEWTGEPLLKMFLPLAELGHVSWKDLHEYFLQEIDMAVAKVMERERNGN